MALSDIEIFAITAPHLPKPGHDEIWDTAPEYAKATGVDKGARWIVPEMTPENTLASARAIEAEVRKEDDALIRQLVEALENSSDLVFKDTTKADARDLAITAGRARLEGKA